MKLFIDTNERILRAEQDGKSREMDLYTEDAFELLSGQWLNVGWSLKYPYIFSWLGRPIIQLPSDMIRMQEVIYRLKPDVIIETGIAHGGSLIFSASVCTLLGKGRVIGVDIEIRPHNRQAIETHELFPLITLIEGDSVAGEIVARVKSLVQSGETVLVVLDSNHTKQHVLNELNAYADLVTPGSYIVTTDGLMKDLYDVPRADPTWRTDNPSAAAEEFVAHDGRFVIDPPHWPFNESPLTRDVTHWPGAWLKRL
uniref:Cephalosporin hydroxylase n=1 Tax=Candidatus Kentrum sp. FM TaxID=2126340 RepID=A0A450SMI8_9GAMM|nr:MAG: Cephalosporin hydroxylase [Candidatus Kentron sp. FM]VFJ60924.1 MAG: Cephalosporin hydroxylase [Candidatus Kentron sp. FM]VFK12182.1 MAG: Cephalosporin hydroxylase [Candidatus Kentron sp. FM]